MRTLVVGVGIALVVGVLPVTAGAQAPLSPLSVAVNLAEHAGTIEGKPTVEQMTVGQALEKTTGTKIPKGVPLAGPPGAYEKPAILVIFHGHFSAGGEPLPSGVTSPVATTLEVVVEIDTGEVRAETFTWAKPAKSHKRKARSRKHCSFRGAHHAMTRA